jgi:polyisoprenyl-phosphate glycosyltransferase
MTASDVDISVVVPVYNSAESLQELHERLVATFDAMGRTFETIFVNDGSADGSFEVLRSLHSQATNVKVVDMIRNAGQHTALMCGFQLCTGAIVVTIDDDLQHAPEDIPLMIKRLEEGYDAVFGAFEKKQHGFLANRGSAAMRQVSMRLFHPPPGFRDSALRAVRREVVDLIKTIRTPFPFVSGMILSVTDRVANVTVTHASRKHGSSGYSLRGRVRLSWNLLINYSGLPLRVMGVIGLFASLTGLVIGVTFLTRKLLIGTAPPGWTSLVVVVSFFMAVMFMMMFMIGEYLSRILRELSHRSSYGIRERLE